MYTPLYLPPGMVSNGTPQQSIGRWREGNFVRWNEGILTPVGGWRRRTDMPLNGRPSAILPFRDNVQRRHIAVGTNIKAYVLQGVDRFDITPADLGTGPVYVTPGNGYGSGIYSDHTYGTARLGGATDLSRLPTDWSFASWGEILLGVASSDGRLMQWSPGDLGTPPDAEFSVIAEAPIDNRGMLVTNERHVLLIGAGGDPRLVAWCHREDFTTWVPEATNTAGDLLLEVSGSLVCGFKVGSEILILSDNEAFALDFVGAPLQYGSRQIGVACGIVGPKAGVSAMNFAAWMGPDGFFTYNGQVQPLPCDVWDFVYRDINRDQMPLVCGGHNGEFGEVWWFFPKGDATHNTHYVIWNYQSNVWATGTLQRTAWADRGVWGNVLATGRDSHLYDQDVPLSTDGLEPRSKPYIKSAPFELANGDSVTNVINIMPDRDNLALDALSYEFETRPNPRSPVTTHGPYFPDSDGFTNVRFVGRQFTMTVRAVQDRDWRLGRLKADIRPGGKR